MYVCMYLKSAYVNPSLGDGMATRIYIYEKRHISINSRLNAKSVQKRDITCTYVAELELFAKEWVLVWCDVGNAGARA